MKYLATFLLLFLCLFVQAQFLTAPSGGSSKATVTERIGITDITISYSRPGVKGREGKIWGQLVPYGFTDLGFGLRTPAPWRAGANENTTFTFSHPVKIEGKDLPAGKYGFHIAVGEEECTLIFSNNSTSWGSFFYQEKEDALRVNIKPVKTEVNQEWLTYEFSDFTNNSAVVLLLWEKMKFPFKVEVDLHNIVLASFRRELQNTPGFNWQSLAQAANYCLQNNVNLEEGLTWSDQAISAPFIGQKNFNTLQTKAQLLAKLNKNTESEEVMKQAVTLADINQLHQYGRQLLNQKKNKEAYEIFKLNATKHPNTWPVNVGLTRGYSAIGDYKTALKYAKLAHAEAPDKLNKDNLEKMIKTLEQNKDANVQ